MASLVRPRLPRSRLVNTTIASHRETEACGSDHTHEMREWRLLKLLLVVEDIISSLGRASGQRNEKALFAELSWPSLITMALDGCFSTMRMKRRPHSDE